MRPDNANTPITVKPTSNGASHNDQWENHLTHPQLNRAFHRSRSKPATSGGAFRVSAAQTSNVDAPNIAILTFLDGMTKKRQPIHVNKVKTADKQSTKAITIDSAPYQAWEGSQNACFRIQISLFFYPLSWPLKTMNYREATRCRVPIHLPSHPVCVINTCFSPIKGEAGRGMGFTHLQPIPPCRAHTGLQACAVPQAGGRSIALQGNAVTQAWCMHHETPATPCRLKPLLYP